MTDRIARLRAALSGRYTVEGELGEGGMATVYLATDVKHDRKVAIKVLKPELAAVLGANRFLGEIRTTANLQHPGILPLHDSGEADSFLYYVMPHVAGESLRNRLDRERQLPVEEAVRIATDVAGALQYAHQQGVIHRDVKPANILLVAGRPVISDFGIALAVGTAGGGRLTETGLSLGTPHYMSPEQATGAGHLGPATDIYALGCVLYEMLVGEPPFRGATPQAILGRIVTGGLPHASEERKSVPSNVDAAIRKALEKVPADRFGTAQGLADALADPGFRHGEAELAGGRAGLGRWTPIRMSLVAAALFAAGAVGWLLPHPRPPAPVSRLELSVPPGVDLATSSRRPIVSPDGTSIVFVVDVAGGSTELWRRPLDQLAPSPVANTDGAESPVFSPDGRSLAFVVLEPTPVIRTVSITGAPGRTVFSGDLNPAVTDLAWGADDMIYFTQADGHISRVPASGGQPERVTTLRDGDSFHASTSVLPGDRGLLFVRARGAPANDSVAVASFSTHQYRTLFGGRYAQVLATGHLAWGTVDGRILAAPFDPKGVEVTGPPRTLIEGVATTEAGPTSGIGLSLFAISASGVLTYVPAASLAGANRAELVWVSRNGSITPADPGHEFTPPFQDYSWSLSPQGDRVALTQRTDGQNDIWIKELPAGPFERLTFGEALDLSPTWTPDGRSVTYTSGNPELLSSAGPLLVQPANGTGEPESLFLYNPDPGFIQSAWRNDGSWIVFRTATADPGKRDIFGFRPGVDSIPVPLLDSPSFAETGPALSPDGRWMAYSSDMTGREQVYVSPFPDVGAGRAPVSVEGGWGPQWAHRKKELFFLSGDGRLMAASFETEPEFRVVSREALFTPGKGILVPSDHGDDFFDVAPDDQSFLMARQTAERRGTLIVVQNFFEELKAGGAR